MRLKKYSSDLSASGWQFIEKLIPVKRKSKWPLEQIVNAIFYVTRNGCLWRDLPGEFPCWQTVYWYYQKWIKEGTWEKINQALILEHRLCSGKKALPGVGIIDSQSVKNSITCTDNVGVDGGKKIKGRKRFFLVDTLGNLLDSFVVAANEHDSTASIKEWATMMLQNPLLEELEKIFADGTFGGSFLKEMQQYFITVEIPSVPIAYKKHMQIHAKRWIVERTIAWTNNYRRCAKDYERKTNTSKAFIISANIQRLVKKI